MYNWRNSICRCLEISDSNDRCIIPVPPDGAQVGFLFMRELNAVEPDYKHSDDNLEDHSNEPAIRSD